MSVSIAEIVREFGGMGPTQRLALINALKTCMSEPGKQNDDNEPDNDAALLAAASNPQRLMRIQAAAGEAKRLGVKVVDGRVDIIELDLALRASGKTPEQRMALKGTLAAAGFID